MALGRTQPSKKAPKDKDKPWRDVGLRNKHATPT